MGHGERLGHGGERRSCGRGGYAGEMGTYGLRNEERRRHRGYGRVRGMGKT